MWICPVLRIGETPKIRIKAILGYFIGSLAGKTAISTRCGD